MKKSSFCLVLGLMFATQLAAADGRVPLNGDTDECELFRALNGSEAVPEGCKVSTRSAFGPPPTPSRPQAVVLERINFHFDSDRLTEDSRADLARVAKVMGDPVSDQQLYQVDGYTDMKGDPDYNLELSQRRAKSVRRFLVGQGVPAQRLHARGYGAQNLADPDHPYDVVNRRVEVINLGQGGGL